MSETGTKTETAGKPKQAGRRWTTILLAVSLTLNLLILGIFTGAHMRGGMMMRGMGPAGERSVIQNMGYSPFIDAMPREHRAAMAGMLREKAGNAEDNRRALAGELLAMLKVLRSEPFEPTALSAIMQQQQARLDESAAAGRDLLVERIASMSPAQRQAFANKLEQLLRRAMVQAQRH